MRRAWASGILSFLVILAVVFTASRALVRWLPGSPLDALIAESGTAYSRAELNAQFHLDEPFLPALLQDAARFLHGDFGFSLLTHRPIATLLPPRVARSGLLALTSLALALGISIPLGTAAAGMASSVLDDFCLFYGSVFSALPTPWLGPVLMLALAVKLPFFEPSGSLALPALTLGLGFSATWSLLVRARVRETLALGAAMAARARGLPEWRVVIKYGFAPARGALLAYWSTQAGALWAGAVVTEAVFDWRGMGSLFVQAVAERDYPLIEAAVFFSALFCLLGARLGDFLQNRSDPRLATGQIG